MVSPLFVLFIMIFVFLIAGLFLLYFMSWNIPITVLRFTGDKRRPMVIHKKGKKRMVRGVPHLQVRGYKTTIRDFKSDYYYPGYKSKYGALILWEFEDGWLTPTVPMQSNFPKEIRESIDQASQVLHHLLGVDFDYDSSIHHKIKLKVVDDVDMEFAVDQALRTDGQYSGGFWAFMEKYGNHVTVIFIVIMLFTGFVLYMKNAPNLSAQCLSNLQQVVQDDFLSKASAYAPGG